MVKTFDGQMHFIKHALMKYVSYQKSTPNFSLRSVYELVSFAEVYCHLHIVYVDGLRVGALVTCEVSCARGRPKVLVPKYFFSSL